MKTAEHYVMNPVLMNGKVKSIDDQWTAINLNGRLGLLTMDNQLVMNQDKITEGDSVEFFFSYIQTADFPMDYDYQDLLSQDALRPSYIDGKIIQVDDVAIKVAMSQDLGTLYVPRRWVIANNTLKPGMVVDFFLSKIRLK